MERKELDEIDRTILKALERDARTSYTDLGKLTGLSRVAAKNRVDALIKAGVIQGFRTRIAPGRGYENPVEFIMDLAVDPDRIADVADALAKMEDIRKVYLVSRQSTLHAEGVAPSNAALARFVDSLYKGDLGVQDIRLETVLSVLKDSDGGVDYDGSKIRSDQGTDGNAGD